MTKEKIIQEVSKIQEQYEEINTYVIKRRFPSLYQSILKCYRNPKRMMTMEKINGKLNKKIPLYFVKDEIKKLYEKYGFVTTQLLEKEIKLCYNAKVFGKFSTLLEDMGIPLIAGQRKMIEKEEVEKEVKRIIQEFGYFSKPLMEKYSNINTKVVARIYGSFENLYKEMDIDRHPSGRIPTNEELILAAKKVFEKFKCISYDILDRETNFSIQCYRERFKTIKKIKELAQISYEGKHPMATYVFKKYSDFLKEEPILEKTFDWLKNPKTKMNLKIDAYFPRNNIAIEYNGPQHYKIDTLYITNQEMLKHRKYLDSLKQELLKEHEIKTVVVHYKDKLTDEYIKNSLV